MFWSGNYIVVRELNFLLKEENVSLSQVLEADDILQECKADNKGLIQFLTKPEILAELITLITEEPPKNVELSQQYRHASIACEVLTSHLSMLSDRLSLDATQMHRLCDFINREPPLNPLLASYFSKTVEMLLERSPKQDWYLYHIVCLRVLDFLKARRDFLPNLLRHVRTSAIADTFKYFIRLDDLFNKIIMEWFEEHQLLESLIQIVCGTYVPEPLCARDQPPEHPPAAHDEPPPPPEHNHKDAGTNDNEHPVAGTPDENLNVADAEGGAPAPPAGPAPPAAAPPEPEAGGGGRVASDNAAMLLIEVVGSGCADEGVCGGARTRTAWALGGRLQSAGCVRSLLQHMFTAPAHAARHALVNGCRLLQALLEHDQMIPGSGSGERTSVELGVAPHLPLLHQALRPGAAGGAMDGAVGAARLAVAALLAHLTLSEVEEVATTMLTLGTPGALVDMFFEYPHNNFLHAHVLTLVKHALNNRVYRQQYAAHLLVECGLVTRLMDVFEENEDKKCVCSARSGYMGHVVGMLRRVSRALDPALSGAPPPDLPPDVMRRWQSFHEHTLAPLLHQHDTPLGGFYPSENIYEVEHLADTALCYQFNDMSAAGLDEDIAPDDASEVCVSGAGSGAGGGAGARTPAGDALHTDQESEMIAKKNFMQLARERFNDDMWDDAPEDDEGVGMSELGGREEGRLGELARQDLLADVSPWECAGDPPPEEQWAAFSSAAFVTPAPVDPFAAPQSPQPPRPNPADFSADFDAELTPYWSSDACAPQQHEVGVGESGELGDAGAELANNLLTAMSSMTPEVIANIVNANMPTDEHPHDIQDGDSCHRPVVVAQDERGSPADTETTTTPAESTPAPAPAETTPASAAESASSVESPPDCSTSDDRTQS